MEEFAGGAADIKAGRDAEKKPPVAPPSEVPEAVVKTNLGDIRVEAAQKRLNAARTFDERSSAVKELNREIEERDAPVIAEIEKRNADPKLRAQFIDKRDGTETEKVVDFVRSIEAEDEKGILAGKGKHFRLAKTNDSIKDCGLTGDYFTIRGGVILRHKGKDSKHSISADEWVDIAAALTEKKPLLVERYKAGENSYRIWTDAKIGGKTAIVGVDVKNVGKDMEVNSIATAFGASGAMPKIENVIYPKTKKEIQSFITRHNSGRSTESPSAEISVPQSGSGVKASMPKPAPSIKMKDEAAEKLAQKQEDDLAALFDTPEFSSDSIILSGDEVRKTMPGYDRLDWSTHVDRSGYVGARLEEQFQRLLKERKGKGNGTVVFLAGGNGAGKSTCVEAAELQNADFVIDSTLGNIDVAKKQIDAILANGQTPVIHFVYRAPGQALEGIRNRVKSGGHIVSPLSFANSHVKSRETLRLLSDTYGDRIQIRIYDNSVESVPELTLEQLEAKRKPDHAKLREEANFYLGHLRDREKAVRVNQGNATGSGAKGQAEEVAFDTPEFNPDVFQKRVGAVATLVKTYKDNGVAEFRTLATRMAERFPDKFSAMKPYLRGVWNAVADQMNLPDVSRVEAEKIYGTIETQSKEAANGRDLRHEGSSGVGVDAGAGGRGNNRDRPDGGVRATANGGGRPGGILAGGRVRPENPDGRVGRVGTGVVSGQFHGLAESEVAETGSSGSSSTAGGNAAVADSAGHADGELEAGGDTAANGIRSAASIKKNAKKAADATKPNPPRRDFVMTKAVEDAILEKKTARRVRNNLDAIKLIRELKARDYAATPEEQETLAKFVGWGGLREGVFGHPLEYAYRLERDGNTRLARKHLRLNKISDAAYELHKELRLVLNDNEYESAKASSSTAFYTPIDFVHVLHDALRRIGVKGGRFLGPSAGTGNFASAAGEYEKPVNWQFVEKDVMTGEMLRALFPNQRVNIGGFEETKFPDGFFDFAIDNVPYADVPISDRSLSSKMFKIHDYFFAKTLAKLRPGGVMAFLTSTGTLDKTSPTLRQFLTKHGGKIVGAVRLPNGFFAENAGTDVASDLVIVQKVSGRPDNSAFEKGVEYGKTDEWVRRKGKIAKPLTYNGYFRDHPGQVIGKMEIASGQFGPTLKYTMPENADEMLMSISGAIDRALDGVDKEALLKSATVAKVQEHIPIYDAEGLRQGNVTMKGGKPFIKSGDMLEPISLPNDRALAKELAKRLKSSKNIMDGLIDLRKAMRDVIDAQMNESDGVEADLAPLWAKLNDVYDEFVKKNGSLHDKWVLPFVMLDKADGNRMLALERTAKDENGKPKIVKSDIFSKRIISRGQRASKADTPKDALVISYSETGTLNVPRIAELLDTNEDTAVEKLKEGGDVFENPQTGRLEPSWEYLSGRVRAKLAAARAAVDAGEGAYRANIEALEKVRPPMVRLEDTEIKFGATWVDAECMKDFLRDAFGSDGMRIALGKNEVTGQWNVDFGRVMNENPWGETSWSPMDFVSRVLNHGSMNHFVTDPVDKKRYLDERQTEANKLAAEKLHHAFSQFIQSSEKWAEPCYERYNAVMTDMVELRLPINILPFREAGMSEIALGKLFENGDPAKPKKGREYQSAVIARGVLGGNSLCLAHCVGAGKTLEMQSIGILGRHLGMFKKPMYVVPNHMLEQFTNKFVEAFPNANILKMSEADVKPERRRAFFAQVANGDWDAIVVKHSTFSKKLGMSSEYQKKFLEEQIRDLNDAIEAMRDSGERISVDQANKKKERLEKKLEQLANEENHDSQIVPFEELGVDQLFVDEAHNFKGMPITTSQGRTGGLSQGDSQRAVDMQMKTEYVQSLHGGDRGVVFATGTPLSNAPVVEAYVMLKYLAPNKLEEQGLKHFDDFVSAFGRITTESEFSHDGKTVKEKEKVSAFVNIPELMKLLRSVVDIVNQDQLDIPRPKPKYHMIDVDMTPAQEAIMEMVAREASTPPSRKDRNKYLTLTRIAKSACLTPRLLGCEDGGNKIIRAVAEIKKMYDETADNRGTQLVFTDIFNLSEASGNAVDEYINSDDKAELFDTLLKRGAGSYNLNEEMRDLLVAAGVPKDEIAIIQDIDKSKGDKDANKSALFAKVSSGEVRVLIGSRQKMGEGTNVQERLAAIHLLHPGWKPAEDEQAIGRIIRFENTYKEGQIFYYLTKGNANIGSYETKNHQLIGVKSKLIDQVMHGDDTVREIDMDESAIDRDMLMGLASGNKALMELIDVKKRVHKLELNTESTVTSARRNKDKAEANARILKRRREEFAKEQEGVKEWREKNDGKSFILSTPDGRSIEKVKDMAEYVAAQMTKLLTQDRYDRTERTVLGDFNGVEMILTYDKYGDEKFRLAVPLLGVTREINYSGFIPDFSQAAMTAFKGKIFETVSPDFAKAYENQLADMDRQAKKMFADADRLQKDYEGMRDELIKLRTRQAELERTVTPLMIQAVEDRKIAAYGNWIVTKPAGSTSYVAQRESDAKRLSAKTVKELIPLMDAEDFASPKNAATKTADLRLRLKPNSEGKHPGVDTIPVGEVDFDTPEMAAGYRERLTFVPVDEPTAKATIRKWRDERKDFVNRRNGRHAELKADWGKIFSETAKKKSADYTAHYSAANRLDTLFENAVKMWGEPPRNGSADISAYSKYGCPFVVGNTPYLAKITVKEYADAGQKDGFYSIEAISVEKISAGGINAGITSVEGHELDPDATAAISEMLQATPGSIAQRGGESKGVDFDTPNLTPAEEAYGEAEDKTPTERVMREVYGMTNEEIATALKASGMEPPKHVRKPDETAWKQAEALLSNPSYMAKLSRAVAKFPRNIADYENNALNVLFRQRQAAVNAAKTIVDGLKETLDAFDAIPKDERDAAWADERQRTAKEFGEANTNLAQAKSLMYETGLALTRSSSEAGRRLRANRGLIDQTDYSYAGISGQVAAILGGDDKITPEMDAKIREIVRDFASLDEQGRDLATARLKAHAEKIVEQIKNGDRIRKAAERKPGDEAKRVMRNYNDAIAQIEVGAAEVGGTLVGLSDQQYPAWGRWLRALGEFHCFENPDITEEECIKAIVEDISPFMDGVNENQVRDALTGFGHNFRQSRYDSQRMMNDLRSQARLKRQLDWMNENNTMPPLTGMVRDEPSDTTRNLQKQVQERKKEVPDAGRDARRLKGVLESAKTRVKNRIADLERAIETGEKIPGRERTVPEDIELRALRQRRDELQKTYDELFKTERGLTEEQRVKLAERLLSRELEHALEDLDRARAGDFSKRPKRVGLESPSLAVLRERIADARSQIRELKKAKYEFGMTPEELSAYNARKMANREKVIARLAERIVNGDISPQKKPQPPMPTDMKKRYDALGEQMNRAHRKLADLRREAANARRPKFVRFAGDAYRFIDGVWKMATASLDFTQVGNQTGTILMAHPKLVAKEFARTLPAFKSQTNADNIELDLLSDPSVKEAVDNKWLHWKRVSDSSNRGDRVELFDAIDRPFTIGGKALRLTDIPLYGTAIANSDRLYATYINAVSASLYSSIVNDPKLFPGGATVFQKKMICDMINVMNGSGTLSKDARRHWGKVFWAPGLVDSQLKRLLGYQIWHPWVASSEEDGSGTFKERVQMSKIGLGEFVRSNLGALLLGGLLFALFATDDQKDEYSRADA
ncbi:MAG: zeta toxin family protein, partial [Kiritimatiellia bacterium]